MYAIIDIGSNTIRLNVYQVEEDGAIHSIFQSKETAGLAGYVREDGSMSREGLDRAADALLRFRSILDALHIENRAVFATASLRNIVNTEDAVQTIREVTGLTVEVLSGADEAALSFQGAAAGGGASSGLLTDIGGGSTELVAYDGGRISSGCSLPMGSLSLYTRYVAGLFPTREERRAIREQVEAELERARTAKVRCRHLTGVGGTIRAAAKLCNDLAGTDPDNRIIPAGELQTLYKGLKKGDRDTLRQILRSAPDRVHTILPGLIILNAVMKSYGVETVSVSACGVREGYLMNRVMGVTQHD